MRNGCEEEIVDERVKVTVDRQHNEDGKTLFRLAAAVNLSPFLPQSMCVKKIGEFRLNQTIPILQCEITLVYDLGGFAWSGWQAAGERETGRVRGFDQSQISFSDKSF